MAKRRTDTELAEKYDAQTRKLRAKRLLEIEKSKAKRQKELLATYDAGKINRTNRDWPWSGVSANSAITGDLSVVTARVRQTVRDFWAAASAADGRGRHAVGTGLRARSVSKDPASGEVLKDFNDRKDQLWRRWYKKSDYVDIEKSKNFVDFQRLVDRECFVVGNAFIVKYYKKRDGNIPGIAIRIFEVEQLDTTLQTYEGNKVVNGIEVDVDNAAVAYHFYTDGHPYDNYYSTSTRVPADRVIHYYRQDRARQLLGISKFVASMVKGNHLTMYEGYELLKTRMEATMTAMLSYDPEYNIGDTDGIGLVKEDGDDGLTPIGDTEVVLEPAAVIKIPRGQKLDFHDPTSPNKNAPEYIDQQISEYAAGLSLDFSLIKRDYSKGNFSSQRQALIELNTEIDAIQQQFIDDFLQPIREWFTDVCVLQGLLDAPGYYDDPEMREAYLEDKWIAPARPWIDPAKAAAANLIELETGSKTLAEIAESQGQDWRELLDQRAAEAAYAAELGLVLPWIHTLGSETDEEKAAREEFSAANKKNVLKMAMEETG